MPRPRRQPPRNQIAQIRRTLKRAGDPQWKYAKDLAAASRISGRPWQLIAAIAQAESSGGKYTPSNAPFNFWGWSVYTGRSSSAITNPFKNPHTAYRYYAKGLKKGYSGGNSIYDPVWEKYAASPAWQGNVASFMRKYGANPNAMGGPNVARGAAAGSRPVRGGGRAGGVQQSNPQMRKLKRFVLSELANGTRASELLPMVLLAKSMIKTTDMGQDKPHKSRAPTLAGAKFGRPPLRKFTMGGGPGSHGSRPLGNWQSDHAWDLMAPAGTPVYAIADGVIDPGAGFGFSSNGSTVWGHRFTLKFGNNAAFYTHLGKFAPGLKPGRRVKRGQLLGWLGDPPGFAPHLHIGLQHGDISDFMHR